MAIAIRIFTSSAFQSNFYIGGIWTTTSTTPSATNLYDYIGSAKSYNYPGASGTYYLHLAILPKTTAFSDTLLATNGSYNGAGSILQIPYGKTTSAVTSATESLVKQRFAASFNYNSSTGVVTNSNILNFTRRTVKIDDDYGGYHSGTGYHVRIGGFTSADSPQICNCIWLDLRNVTVNTSHCELYFNGSSNYERIASGTYKCFQGQLLGELGLHPETNYSFATTPTYKIEEPDSGFITFTAYDSLDIIGDYLFSSGWTDWVTASGGGTDFVFTAIGGDTPVTENYPFINVYNPSNEDLGSLANVRFIGITSGGSYTVDLGQYILNVFKLFVDIPTDTPSHIFLLNYDTNIECPVVTDFKVTVNCGHINILRTTYTNLDYDAKTYLYLPFYDTVELETDKYMNTEIHLKYVVDILTGDCTIYTFTITSEYDEGTDTQIEHEQVIDMWNCNIAYNIPYRVGNPSTAFYSQFETNSKMFMDKTPSLYYYVHNYYTGFTREYNERRELSYFVTAGDDTLRRNIVRFTDVELIGLPITCTDEEREELKELFETGVIYKEPNM